MGWISRLSDFRLSRIGLGPAIFNVLNFALSTVEEGDFNLLESYTVFDIIIIINFNNFKF